MGLFSSIIPFLKSGDSKDLKLSVPLRERSLGSDNSTETATLQGRHTPQQGTIQMAVPAGLVTDVLLLIPNTPQTSHSGLEVFSADQGV